MLNDTFLFDLSSTGTTLTTVKKPIQSAGAQRVMGVITSNTTFNAFVEISPDFGTTWTQAKKIASSGSAPYFAEVSQWLPAYSRITAQNGAGGGGFGAGTVAGLQVWYKADSGLFQLSNGTTAAASNGDVVGYWADQSGNNNNATQVTTGNKPTLVTSGLNSLPVVRYASGNFMSLTNLALSGAWTVYIVVNRAINQGAFLGDSGSSFIGCYSDNNSYITDSANVTATYAALSNTGAIMIRAHRPGAASNIAYKVTGVAEVSNIGAALGTINLTQLMKQSSHLAVGDLAEILIYNADLSTSDRSTIEAYLLTKWG